MDGMVSYLLTIVSAAIICAVAKNIVGHKSAMSGVVRFLCGLFLVYCVISPWHRSYDLDLSSFIDSLRAEAGEAVSAGENMALDSTADIIKAKTQAYILDKADSMDLDISVEVTLDESTPPQPCVLTIAGEVSPYGKKVLSQYIEDNLDIPKEAQIWE